MKWGRKKPLSPSLAFTSPSSSSAPRCSQPSSLISHVLSVSWLSKLKHKSASATSEPTTRKLKPPQGKFTSHPSKCPGLVVSDHGNFELYDFQDDGDNAFWRLSFGQDGPGEKSEGVGPKPKRASGYHGSDNDDETRVSCSKCPDCGKKQARNSGAMKESNREKEAVLIRSPRRAKSSRELKSYATKRSTSPGLKKVDEEGFSGNEMSFDMKSLREILKPKSEEHRKSLHVSVDKKKRTKQRSGERVKAYSPRTASRAETCKVKALEDMKKAKLMRKKMMKERTGLDSFAVEKSTYDPRKDFKESMIEMILEKKLRQPEELEELLACYLTLNSDELHGLIIKVFREVWFELSDLEMEQVLSD